MNKFEYKKLTPFKWYVLQNFPFIEADFDALTNYQLLCKVIDYLNKTIDNMNLTGEQMENLTKAMSELQNYVNNYFDNLDVQEEVNNKLNQMVQDGTLANILLNYSNTYKIYNTYEDFINDIDNLSINVKITILGYYEVGDGGYSIYYITNNIDNSKYQIELKENLYATLILENPKKINVLQLGLKNDGIFNNANILNEILNNKKFNGYIFYFPKGVYYLTNSINVNIRCTILGDVFSQGKITYDNTPLAGSILKFNCESLVNKNAIEFTNSYKYSMENMIILGNSYNIDVNRDNISDGVNINNTFTPSVIYENVNGIYTNDWGKLKNIKVQGFSNYGLCINYYSIIDNCEFYFCNIGLFVTGSDNRCTNLRFYTCNLGLRLKDNSVGACQFNNIRMDEIATYGIYIGKYTSGNIITNYVGDYINYASVFADSCKNCIISNSKLNRCGVLYSGFKAVDIDSGNLDKACGIYCKNLQPGNNFSFECSYSSNKDGSTDTKFYGPSTAIAIGGTANQSPRNNFEVLGNRNFESIRGIPTADELYSLIISKDNGFIGNVKYMNNLIECMPLRNDPTKSNNLYNVAVCGSYIFNIGNYINNTSKPQRPSLITKYNNNYYLSTNVNDGDWVQLNN